jgi:hypothetical protein
MVGDDEGRGLRIATAVTSARAASLRLAAVGGAAFRSLLPPDIGREACSDTLRVTLFSGGLAPGTER